MTGREKIAAALSADGSGEVPAVICYEGIFIRDHWEALGRHPWWHQFSPRLDHQLTWRRDVIGRIGQDWFCLPACPSRADREALEPQDRPDGVWLVDRRTGRQTRLRRPEVGGWDSENKLTYTSRPTIATSHEQVDAAIPPVEPFDAGGFIADGRADLSRRLLEDFGASLLPIRHSSSPLWNCYGLWGFEGMMLMVADRPELVERACRRFLAHRIRDVHEAAALGAKAVWIEECLTDMVSPEAFARLNVPFVRRLVEEIRSVGMSSIYYYCGDPSRRWDGLLAPGADALALEEGKKGFAIEIEDVVARAAGRCAVLGNLNAIGSLQCGSQRQLRHEIARQIAAARPSRGRFIMSIGSPVTPATPVQRVRLYCDTVHELGRLRAAGR